MLNVYTGWLVKTKHHYILLIAMSRLQSILLAKELMSMLSKQLALIECYGYQYT